ncbi:MAG: hypothetical protein QOJ71_2589, partial [Actinomycetota bacterium]|nr:hypothetical protein [Actinomycetota bacterium]
RYPVRVRGRVNAFGSMSLDSFDQLGRTVRAEVLMQ